MAQKTIVQLIDDLDGKPIADGDGETVTFSLDGITYETDLSAKNAQALRDAFGTYVNAGRKVSGSRSSGSRRSSAAAKRDYDPKDVREWAKKNKVTVPERGRIPAEVIEQYKAAV
jgi:hypothetical protein